MLPWTMIGTMLSVNILTIAQSKKLNTKKSGE